MQKLQARTVAVVLLAAALTGYCTAAMAVDGVIEINQAKVMANGGFPFAINLSGSYRLTSSLFGMPADAIDIKVCCVTLDLNGFTISPGGANSGTGINSTGSFAVTIRNGSVLFFKIGVQSMDGSVVERMHVERNGIGIISGSDSIIRDNTANFNTGGPGIDCQANCVISGNTANHNGFDGIETHTGNCQVSGNTANSNRNNGIELSSSGNLAQGNTLASNNAFGLTFVDFTSGYANNVMFGNQGTTSGTSGQVSGGKQIGQNLCNGQLCP